MHADDLEFLASLESGAFSHVKFGHRDHVRAAWILLQIFGPQKAQVAMERVLQAILLRHGAHGKFHKTLTLLWLRLVEFHASCHPACSFAEFAKSNAELFDKNLPLRFYSKERLFSPAARNSWIEPDLRIIPAA